MKKFMTALFIVGLWASSFGTAHAAGIGVVAGIRG